MRLHAKAITKVAQYTHAAPNVYYGVLFRFGEVSGNRTVVKPGASVRVAGDAVLIEHQYLPITEYKPAGRVMRFYERDGALLVEFELQSPEAIAGITNGRRQFLSVSWFSDNYVVREYSGESVIEFGDIVIYEVSLVESPAFNTCIATEEGGLSCLSSLGACKCGCRGKHVSLDGMLVKHQEVTREEFEALRELVAQTQEAVALLQKEVQALKDAVSSAPQEVVEELEQAKQKLTELEAELSTQSNSLSGTLAMLEKLVAITERTYKNIPNITRR